MDILTQVLIGVAVFIISALLIWFISAFSMKEKTFEEVMEEQRRQQEEEREKVRAEKKSEREKSKNKYKKTKQEKVKDKNVPNAEPEVPVVQKMVQLEIEPEIIEPTESLGLSAGVRNRGKKDKAGKSILHNKDDVPLIDEKPTQVHHKAGTPKDELELKKSHEKVVVEKMEKAQVSETHTSQLKEKKSKGEHKEKENMPPVKADKKEDMKPVSGKGKSSDDAPLSAPRVISFVKSAKLSDNEVQNLIDILLNKQGLTPSGPAMIEDSWNKKGQKGDSVTLLKKQVDEKEQALQEEKKVAMNANARLKETKSELLSEKSKVSAMEKQYQDKLLRQKNEMDALQARMQKTHEQHVAETNNLQTRLRQQDQGMDKAVLTKLADEKKIVEDTLSMKIKENTALSDKMKIIEKELSSTASKTQANESSRKSLENQLKSSEAKIKKLEANQKEVDALVGKRVEEVSQEFRKTEAKNSSLKSDLEKASGAVVTAQAEVSTLKAKLQELEAHLTKSEEVDTKLQNSERKRQDLEGNLKNLEKQLSDLTKNMADKDIDLKHVQQENKTLVAENKTVKEKLQTLPASNGDVHDSEKQLLEKGKEIADLTANLETQKKSASSLQVQLDTRNSEVEDLQKQLSQQKAKNNELREKNWKAMEAVDKAEKSSAEKVDRAFKSARETAVAANSDIESLDKGVLQRLFPHVKVSDKLQHKEWMSTFEKQAGKETSNSTLKNDRVKSLEDENKKLKSSLSDESKKYSALQSDNTNLKSEVDNYCSIVSETESKLRDLEKSIDSEEKRWQEKLKQCQATSNQPNSSGKVKELNSIISQQESQIAEYRNVMALTEDRLKKYEERVASEENSWKEKLSSSESELKKAQNALNALKSKLEDSQGSQEDVSDLDFAYRCVGKSFTSIIDELQAKIEVLETELSDSKEKIIVVTKERETVVQDVQCQLDKERKKNKELSMNAVKLNGIIKTGHDALTEEQQLVRKLQEQLETRSVASGISEAEETEQLRIKLTEKQKHLEKELSVNKQLSERLAANNTENGTSV